jgi:hypothetical protein
MKCKDCHACVKYNGNPDVYVCNGVSEPFTIRDINAECTEYPEKNREPEHEKCKYVVAYFFSPINAVFTTFDTRDAATLYINECSCEIYTPIANEDDSSIEVNCNCDHAYAKVTCGDQFWYWKLCEVKF